MASKISDVLDLNVTAEAIRKSMTRNAKHCAIANAIQESDNNIAWARVTSGYVEVAYHSPEQIDRFASSKAVRDFVVAFDNNRSPKPFRLVIREEDWLSSRPRRMNQNKVIEQRAARKSYANASGKRMQDVHIDEVPVNDNNGFKEVKQAVKRNPQQRPPETKRVYNRRETASESFLRADADRQMALPH